MKGNKSKIIFILSFLPLSIAVFCGLVASVIGIDFFGKVYGIEAFAFVFVVVIACMTIFVPVFPIAIIYQIIYIVNKFWGPFTKQQKKKAFIFSFGMLAFALVVFFCITYSYEIRDYFRKASAKEMVRNAEVSIAYDNGSYASGGIYGIDGYDQPHILIDYDKNEIGFLSGYCMDEFYKFPLTKTEYTDSMIPYIQNNLTLQTIIPLPDQSGTIFTYSIKEDNVYDDDLTQGVIILKNDGTVYYNTHLIDEKNTINNHLYLRYSEFAINKYN